MDLGVTGYRHLRSILGRGEGQLVPLSVRRHDSVHSTRTK